MESQKEIPEYKDLRPLEQKRIFGYRFASIAGIGPQIRELLKMERIPSLKYLAICRNMLFEILKPSLIEPKRKTPAYVPFTHHELISEVNLNSTLFRRQTFVLKNEDGFYELINTINRISLLFIYDELVPKNKKKLFLEGMKQLGETLEFVFGDDSDKKMFTEIDRFVEFSKVPDEFVPDQDSVVDLKHKEDRIIEPEYQEQASLKGNVKVEEELLDRKQMIDILKITYPTLHAHIKKGIVPKPFYIGRKPRWRKIDIMDYLKSKGVNS